MKGTAGSNFNKPEPKPEVKKIETPVVAPKVTPITGGKPAKSWGE